MGLWISVLDQLPGFGAILKVALLVYLSRSLRQPGQLQIWVAAFACLAAGAIAGGLLGLVTFLAGLIQSVAVLLLVWRPPRITISTGRGRILLALVKVISIAWLAGDLVINLWPRVSTKRINVIIFATRSVTHTIVILFASMVLSLSSLQTESTFNDQLLVHWINVVHRICFLWVLVFPLPDYVFYFLGTNPQPAVTCGLSFIIISALLLIGNLQIPAAVVQVVLSSLRFHQLLTQNDYFPLPQGTSENLVPAIEVFYVLALCQGSFYIVASILAVFSFFPRRSLAYQSKLYGRRGAKAVDRYYQSAYTTCMNTGLLATRKTMSLASFALESLHSSSDKVQLAGVLLLDRLLEEEGGQLKSRIISSNTELSRLIGMLRSRTEVRGRYIRQFAAKATAKLAGSIIIAEIPGALKLVSSLFDTENQQRDSLQNREQVVTAYNAVVSAGLNNGEGVVAVYQPSGHESSPLTTLVTSSKVRQFQQKMRENCSIHEEPPSSPHDSLPVLGIEILEKLASDLHNCAEILKDKIIISKIIGLIRYNDNDEQQKQVLRSSLNLLRRLAATGETIGLALRQEMWRNNFLLISLIDVLEDSRSSPQVWEPVMDIIAKLALNKRAGHEIGKTHVVIARLLHAFLGSDESTGTCYDQSLRMSAGEGLANIAIWGTTNCLAILAEPGYEVIKDVKNMLSEDSHRNVAANLLWNICAHCRARLHRHGASEHLSSALPVVMQNIMSARGKQLESSIGLALQICEVIPSAFARELDSHTSAAELVQNLVSTLNSNKKPSPEYPRMRRVIIEITISIVKSCPRYANIFKEEKMKEELDIVKQTPSRLEKYRVMYGNVGVVVESGTPLAVLAAEAKRLIDTPPAPIPGPRQGNHA